MRSPSELGEFRWRVDAKDQTVTQAERLWSTLIFPLLFAQSLRDPYPEIEGADYSHMEPFRPDEDAINQVREFRPDMLAPGTAKPVDLRKIFRDLAFEDSSTDVGLQLADITASIFTRAFNESMGIDGWREFGRLTLRDTDKVPVLAILTSDQTLEGTKIPPRPHHDAVLRQWKPMGKSLFPTLHRHG